MLKSQLVSNDNYSNKSQNENEIWFRIDSDTKFKNLINKPQGSDFVIKHGGQSYPGHKAVISKHLNTHVLDIQIKEGVLSIPEQFNKDLVKGIISSLYGSQFKISRSQGLEAMDIVQFLHISRYKKLIENDINAHFEDYQLFPLLQKAKLYNLHDIYDLCLQQLQREGFQQMRYCKFHLLSCRQDVFKEVINKHNQRRWQDPGFGLGQKIIHELITDYCHHNNISERQKNSLIRQFNEKSIKQDFPVPSFTKNLTPLPPLKFKDNQCKMSIKVYTPRTTNTNSFLVNPQQYNEARHEQNGSKSMIFDLTYSDNRIRKKSQSVRPSDTNDIFKLTCEVFPLKDQNMNLQKHYQGMRENVQKMNKTLKLRDSELSASKYRLSEIERLLEECKKSLLEINSKTQSLQIRANKVQTKRLKQRQAGESNEDEQSDDDNEDNTSRKDQKLSVSLIESKWVCC